VESTLVFAPKTSYGLSVNVGLTVLLSSIQPVQAHQHPLATVSTLMCGTQPGINVGATAPRFLLVAESILEETTANASQTLPGIPNLHHASTTVIQYLTPLVRS